MKYSYKIPDLDDEYDIPVRITSYMGDSEEGLAIAAAEDFHSNHDGWECSWLLEFVILREDGSEVGTYSVEREPEPVFYAYEVKETACTPTS